MASKYCMHLLLNTVTPSEEKILHSAWLIRIDKRFEMYLAQYTLKSITILCYYSKIRDVKL